MSKVFFGGVPTGPDVDRLMREIEAKAGTQIEYAVVSGILGVPRMATRFQVITLAWRKRLVREKGIQTKAGGGAFSFLTAKEAVDKGVVTVHHIGRAIGRAHAQVASIDTRELSPDDQKRQSILTRETAALLDHVRQSAKTIALPTPIEASPRMLK